MRNDIKLKEPIPVHHHDELSDNGIHLKIVKPGDIDRHPVEYAHRDDYYIFGIIVNGSLNCEIDFNTRTIRKGELHFLRPGQVHRFTGDDDFEGWMLIVESCMVGDDFRNIFEKTSFSSHPPTVSDSEMEELKSLYSIIRSRLDAKAPQLIVRHLVSAFIGMVAAKFQQCYECDMRCIDRHMEFMLGLRSLLDSDIDKSHSPSYYAAKLNISTVYLNEIVNKVTGASASAYIRNEIILRAKRLLHYTGMTVKEIASLLGFEDNAYFTRLFTKATGMSPIKFRQKH